MIDSKLTLLYQLSSPARVCLGIWLQSRTTTIFYDTKNTMVRIFQIFCSLISKHLPIVLANTEERHEGKITPFTCRIFQRIRCLIYISRGSSENYLVYLNKIRIPNWSIIFFSQTECFFSTFSFSPSPDTEWIWTVLRFYLFLFLVENIIRNIENIKKKRQS